VSALEALPSEIQPLDRSIPHVDERRGRSPRRGRAFPDLRDEEDEDAPHKPRSPALPVSGDTADVEPEPQRPRVDVHVHH
jgi:hypothetical protein